jgi:DNA-binding protein HU-beta
MTKTELIDRVAAKTQKAKHEVEEAVESVLATISDALANGEKVDLRGFGSFRISDKAERQGRNPRTGESMTIAARRVAAFKPGKELADHVAAARAGTERNATGDAPSAVPGDGPEKLHGDKNS